jgi:hypothetical protein
LTAGRLAPTAALDYGLSHFDTQSLASQADTLVQGLEDLRRRQEGVPMALDVMKHFLVEQEKQIRRTTEFVLAVNERLSRLERELSG